MTAYVGYRQATVEQLRELVEHPAIAIPKTYYFLRWFDRVSGIQTELSKEFPSPEGQLFNASLELRWKRQGTEYDILLLSKDEPKSDLKFTQLGKDWDWCDRPAIFHNSDETKFPKGFAYLDGEEKFNPKNFPIKQRYFFNSQTATVHFIALTLDRHV
ncbi:hypothetical protein [Thermocoleostomius sinensis]|uniref:Uncharacterized protein n=1 Tax=Thermocoleostomius sinensis A174 TaxID=2016057 RepID=A0A9E8ZJW3_9CYAN|nr:hypothetical protein [Thermocoleostomius sinensis]WAL59846.1 hypothetical protein OXH18_22170 [Thermocoleostomius sinensis A174]